MKFNYNIYKLIFFNSFFIFQLTWADFYFASTTTSYNKFLGGDAQDVYANYPNLKALNDKIYDLPAIKKWVAERPETDM